MQTVSSVGGHGGEYILHMYIYIEVYCTTIKPVQALVASERLSHKQCIVSSSDIRYITLEHDRKQAHAVYLWPGFPCRKRAV